MLVFSENLCLVTLANEILRDLIPGSLSTLGMFVYIINVINITFENLVIFHSADVARW